MKIDLIQIGNSQGIRLPKSIIKQCRFSEVIEAEIQDGKLILSSEQKPRTGWADAFKSMAKAGDDTLVMPEVFALSSDDKEWKW
ncbi:MAG: hypothetical protein P4L31_02225 [Candidatus Babeliales bacterium]|nr:hypothetical protein [Candidatus Babeliales bacterium]